MNSGIGVREKLITAALELRTSWWRPASPPRNRAAPTRLMAMNENATSMPMNSSRGEPPSSNNEAICQDIGPKPSHSGRRDGVLPRTPLGYGQPVHPEQKLDRDQHEGRRHRPEQPPFRQDQRLHRDR